MNILSYKTYFDFHNNGRLLTTKKKVFLQSFNSHIRQYYNYLSKLKYSGYLNTLGKSSDEIKESNKRFYNEVKNIFSSGHVQAIQKYAGNAITTSEITFYKRKKSGSLQTTKSRPKKIYFDNIEVHFDQRMFNEKSLLQKDNRVKNLYWLSFNNPYQKGDKLNLSEHDNLYKEYKSKVNIPFFAYDRLKECIDKNISFSFSLGENYIKFEFKFPNLETLKLYKRINDLVDEVKGLDFGKYISTKDNLGQEEQFDLSCFYKRINYLQKQISKLDTEISNLKTSKNFGVDYLRLKEKRKSLFIKISEIKKHTYRYISKKVVTSKTIIVEKLTFLAEPKTSKQYKGRNFNKMINIMSRGLFIEILQDRCNVAGSQLIFIDPKYTSQTCSVCGYRDRRNRKGRLFKCQHCTFRYDADLNAARNILSLGV